MSRSQAIVAVATFLMPLWIALAGIAARAIVPTH